MDKKETARTTHRIDLCFLYLLLKYSNALLQQSSPYPISISKVHLFCSFPGKVLYYLLLEERTRSNVVYQEKRAAPSYK